MQGVRRHTSMRFRDENFGLLKIRKPETKAFENGQFRGPKHRGYSPISPEFPPAAPAIPGRLRRFTPQALGGRLRRFQWFRRRVAGTADTEAVAAVPCARCFSRLEGRLAVKPACVSQGLWLSARGLPSFQRRMRIRTWWRRRRHRTRDLRPATLRACPRSDACGQAGSQSHLHWSGCAVVLQGSALF